ncbi:hypothetical protein M407DRAFT_246978 [Tulasnella calospora MUT 4182]|uniref:Uncharacterized protein n=1 Tax=Tulasnella calospora MUT 4182 TaxID=1051891 RepID=A0A0C3PPL5_9AGAM|nr:hypothetical protein M407DRAFT_246978 [Tulasnella calospora MUT 4182]
MPSSWRLSCSGYEVIATVVEYGIEALNTAPQAPMAEGCEVVRAVSDEKCDEF